MEFEINISEDTLKLIDDFRGKICELRAAIESKIPKEQYDNIDIVYDDYIECAISTFDFFKTLDLYTTILKNIIRVETRNVEKESITI